MTPLLLAALLAAQTPPPAIDPAAVAAHEAALAGPAMRGRGSATPDEAKAAAYVAARFAAAGLKPAPGIGGFVQTAAVVRPRVTGEPRVTVDGVAVAGATLVSTNGQPASGPLAVAADAASLPAVPVALVRTLAPDREALVALAGAARAKGVRLLLVPARAAATLVEPGGRPRMRPYLASSPPRTSLSILGLPDAAIAALARRPGAPVAFDVPVAREDATTSNAIGYLPGRDPAAGVILVSAHLDHLGVSADGTVFPGANDDASGTIAVIELARALAHGAQPRRGILFVCYGSEEIGGLGSRFFGAHPPVPLTSIIANIEFEMIGNQDPKLPRGALMMTGYERSDLGAELRRRGALIAADPYPDQHFFERSDNYSLALVGVVAHTLSGWAMPPTYHQPTDTADRIDTAYMAHAIQSLVAPLRALADGDFRPVWTPGGQPRE